MGGVDGYRMKNINKATPSYSGEIGSPITKRLDSSNPFVVQQDEVKIMEEIGVDEIELEMK